jgi:hypothetical protein
MQHICEPLHVVPVRPQGMPPSLAAPLDEPDPSSDAAPDDEVLDPDPPLLPLLPPPPSPLELLLAEPPQAAARANPAKAVRIRARVFMSESSRRAKVPERSVDDDGRASNPVSPPARHA